MILSYIRKNQCNAAIFYPADAAWRRDFSWSGARLSLNM